MKNIVFCGGGTAGHVMPNIALIEKLKGKANIHYIGGSGIEKNIISKYDFVTYHEISAPKLIRKLTLKNCLIPFKLLSSINQCKNILKNISPSVIFSKGGYISIPVVLASRKTPIFAHESDFSMGLANKIIYKKVNKMFFSFKELAKKYFKKGVFSGTPIRDNIFNGNKDYIKNHYFINPNLPIILVVGGSTGAESINTFIIENLNTLTKKYNIFHITGKNKGSKNINQNNYFAFEFVDNIEDFIASSDFIVSRAGSNAIFEFLVLLKPMLLIPLPLDQSRGDQLLNAQYFEKHGFAKVLQQKDLSLLNFINNIQTLQNNINNIKKIMQSHTSRDATKIILQEINKYI